MAKKNSIFHAKTITYKGVGGGGLCSSLSHFRHLVCGELGLAKSKMASVDEIRTRVSLREHDVINVS